MDLFGKFKQYIQQQNLFNPKDRLLLAVSGGVDSVVLCELCKQMGYDLAIAHCNFQLRGEDSVRDELFVKELAAKCKVPFFSTSFDTKAIAAKERTSIEETARNLRYAWFEQIRKEKDYAFVVTAHHAGDNIETMLMNFFRGTGIKGLHGILPKQNHIVRPLLFAAKKDILDFATANNIAFVTDHTNEEDDFTRNYFRNQLIPAVKKVFPAVEENLLNNIERMGAAEQLYNQAVELHKKKLLEHKGNEVHIPVLKMQKLQPLSTIVYEIIKDFGFTAHQTADVLGLLQSSSGKYVQSATHRIIRNRAWLIISPNKTIDASNILIEEEDKTMLFENGTLQIEKHSTFDISNSPFTVQLDIKEIQFPLLLRKWKQGDYFYPLGMQKKKKLSRFFIDQKLSLTQKENVWVIESNKKILWVIGLRMDDRFKITANTQQVLQLTLKT
ncbi:tRNA lysidine(34) synthetase TilS [Ferruginibacter sp.]